MARLALVSFQNPAGHPWDLGPFRLFAHSAALTRAPHQLVADPGAADAILITDPGPGAAYAAIRASHWWRKRSSRCFVFNPGDHPWPLLPGFYASLSQSQARPGWAMGGFYVHESEVGRFPLLSWNENAPYDFSFVGSVSNALVRQAIQQHWANHPGCRIEDTSGLVQPAFLSGDHATITSLTQRLTDATAASRFVLCPRGVGLCSIRLFETMQMGRVPVILSDGWQPPSGPNWSDFALFVPESDVPRLREICQTHAPHARAMAAAARQAWEDWFSPEKLFQTVAEWCVQLLAHQSSNPAAWPGRYLAQFRLLASPHLARQELLRWRSTSPALPYPGRPPNIAGAPA